MHCGASSHWGWLLSCLEAQMFLGPFGHAFRRRDQSHYCCEQFPDLPGVSQKLSEVAPCTVWSAWARR